tara:strand:- start:3096 stop:3737 length:642 start_codon:yes stop_codon:yes gene_type:complete
VKIELILEMALFFLILFGYFIGSITSGLIIGRIAGVGDVRKYGSGKTGFTNSLRAMGLKWSLFVLTADIFKGVIPVIIGSVFLDNDWAAALGGIATVVGHNWPIFANFKGGRGVATVFGSFLTILIINSQWIMLIPIAILCIFIITIFRYVSLMSVLGVFAGFCVICILAMQNIIADSYFVFGLISMLIIEIKHVGNMKRLILGMEPKIGEGK